MLYLFLGIISEYIMKAQCQSFAVLDVDKQILSTKQQLGRYWFIERVKNVKNL